MKKESEFVTNQFEEGFFGEEYDTMITAFY